MQIRKALAVLVGIATLPGGGGVAAMEPEPAPVVATWKEAEIDFTYIGRTSFYTCESLRQKVARILQAAGARDDLHVAGAMGDDFLLRRRELERGCGHCGLVCSCGR